MLQVETLACARGDRMLFSALSFELHAGELLRVTGPNGSGKTTLLRTLCGLALPAEGSVRWRGVAIRRAREEYDREIAYLGHANALKDELSAAENLSFGFALQGTPVALERVREALASSGLAHCAALPARALSQGQRRRLALTRLALSEAKPLWLLDEPFTALDAVAVERMSALLGEHLTRGGMIVYTTHQDVSIAAGRPREIALGSDEAAQEVAIHA